MTFCSVDYSVLLYTEYLSVAIQKPPVADTSVLATRKVHDPTQQLHRQDILETHCVECITRPPITSVAACFVRPAVRFSFLDKLGLVPTCTKLAGAEPIARSSRSGISGRHVRCTIIGLTWHRPGHGSFDVFDSCLEANNVTDSRKESRGTNHMPVVTDIKSWLRGVQCTLRFIIEMVDLGTIKSPENST